MAEVPLTLKRNDVPPLRDRRWPWLARPVLEELVLAPSGTAKLEMTLRAEMSDTRLRNALAYLESVGAIVWMKPRWYITGYGKKMIGKAA